MKNNAPVEILAPELMSDLAQRVYHRLLDRNLNVSYTPIEQVQFANLEIKPYITETIRGKEVYLFAPMQRPTPNDALVSLLLTSDALKRASITKATFVLPMYSYARQDRKDKPRTPISARAVADLLSTNHKLERIITMDLHAAQIQGFFDFPVDNLYGSLVLAEHVRQYAQQKGLGLSDIVVASPDLGGTERAGLFADIISPDVKVALFRKERGDAANSIERQTFIGEDVKGKTVLLIDDIICTAGSVIKGADKLYELGAKEVLIYATHGLFSPKDGKAAEEKLAASNAKVVITESIPRTQEYQDQHKSWLTMLPLDDIIARAIEESIKIGGSVSDIFPKKRKR
ncbi:MAG TPA: ribose-phosphate diphosphokinase [Acidobacteriota bacterium]|nr:ribose-phosphate diphosphokinase [Acidobacteriota bacterium]